MMKKKKKEPKKQANLSLQVLLQLRWCSCTHKKKEAIVPKPPAVEILQLLLWAYWQSSSFFCKNRSTYSLNKFVQEEAEAAKRASHLSASISSHIEIDRVCSDALPHLVSFYLIFLTSLHLSLDLLRSSLYSPTTISCVNARTALELFGALTKKASYKEVCARAAWSNIVCGWTCLMCLPVIWSSIASTRTQRRNILMMSFCWLIH